MFEKLMERYEAEKFLEDHCGNTGYRIMLEEETWEIYNMKEAYMVRHEVFGRAPLIEVELFHDPFDIADWLDCSM